MKEGYYLNYYSDEIKRSMEFLAKHDKVIFLGQTVGYPGSRFTYKTLKDIPLEKRIELPIAEEVQMGISIGLALNGYIPVSIYPRFDFLLLASNQLINHLDKIYEMSKRQFNPKVIIRTVIGATIPINPGPQHCKDHTGAFRNMLTNVDVIKLEETNEIFPAYQKALYSDRSTLLVELGNKHMD